MWKTLRNDWLAQFMIFMLLCVYVIVGLIAFLFSISVIKTLLVITGVLILGILVNQEPTSKNNYKDIYSPREYHSDNFDSKGNSI